MSSFGSNSQKSHVTKYIQLNRGLPLYRQFSALSSAFQASKFLRELFSIKFWTEWFQSQPPNVRRKKNFASISWIINEMALVAAWGAGSLPSTSLNFWNFACRLEIQISIVFFFYVLRDSERQLSLYIYRFLYFFMCLRGFRKGGMCCIYLRVSIVFFWRTRRGAEK